MSSSHTSSVNGAPWIIDFYVIIPTRNGITGGLYTVSDPVRWVAFIWVYEIMGNM